MQQMQHNPKVWRTNGKSKQRRLSRTALRNDKFIHSPTCSHVKLVLTPYVGIRLFQINLREMETWPPLVKDPVYLYRYTPNYHLVLHPKKSLHTWTCWWPPVSGRRDPVWRLWRSQGCLWWSHGWCSIWTPQYRPLDSLPGAAVHTAGCWPGPSERNPLRQQTADQMKCEIFRDETSLLRHWCQLEMWTYQVFIPSVHGQVTKSNSHGSHHFVHVWAQELHQKGEPFFFPHCSTDVARPLKGQAQDKIWLFFWSCPLKGLPVN